MSDEKAGPKVGQWWRLVGELVEVIAVGERFVTVRTPRRRWYVPHREWPRLNPELAEAPPA